MSYNYSLEAYMNRLQFLTNDQTLQNLDALVESTGLKTRTQVLLTALALFDWAVRERKAGRIIASMDERSQKYKEIELPGLPPVGSVDEVKAQELIDTLLSSEAMMARLTEAIAASGASSKVLAQLQE
jgi:hypothetical protein